MQLTTFLALILSARAPILMVSAQAPSPDPAQGLAAIAHARTHELDGFLLRQSREAFERSLGKPFHEETADGETVLAFHIPTFKSDYLVAKFVSKKGDLLDGKAVLLQLTGDEPGGDTGFFGLRLGDSADTVEERLGKPTTVTRESDADLDLWDFDGRNYTLEFTARHTLYSIQIGDEAAKNSPQFAGRRAARLFALSLQSGDLQRVLDMASGEIECTRSGEAVGVQSGRARAELANAKSPIFGCLQDAAKAILALGPKMKGTDENLRVWERGGAGTVVKFAEPCPLKEMVFVEEAGAPRVYEVTFRDLEK